MPILDFFTKAKDAAKKEKERKEREDKGQKNYEKTKGKDEQDAWVALDE